MEQWSISTLDRVMICALSIFASKGHAVISGVSPDANEPLLSALIKGPTPPRDTVIRKKSLAAGILGAKGAKHICTDTE